MTEEILPEPPLQVGMPIDEDILKLLDGLSMRRKKAILGVLTAAFQMSQTYEYQVGYTKYLQKLAARAGLTGKSQTKHIQAPQVNDISSDARNINIAINKLKDIM